MQVCLRVYIQICVHISMFSYSFQNFTDAMQFFWQLNASCIGLCRCPEFCTVDLSGLVAFGFLTDCGAFFTRRAMELGISVWEKVPRASKSP